MISGYTTYKKKKKHKLAQNVFLEGYVVGDRPTISCDCADITVIDPGSTNVCYVDGYKTNGDILINPFDCPVIVINPIIVEQILHPKGVIVTQVLVAQATTADGDLISLDAINQTPISGTTVLVYLNGRMIVPADGPGEVDTSACYITSSDNTVIRSHGDAQVGDVIHWNGSVAGVEVESTDELVITYEI